MKKIAFILAVSFVYCCHAFAQSGDEASVKQVIEAEKAAGDAADYKTYLSYWKKEKYSSFLYNGILFTGDSLWKAMDMRYAHATPQKVVNTRTNWNVRINGNSAFVTFNQQVDSEDRKRISETREARYLEKTNGQWKIVNMTAVAKRDN